MKKFVVLLGILLSFQAVFAGENVSDGKFYKAVKNGDCEFVKENITKLKDINSSECFLCAAAQFKQNEILNILLENKADPDCPKSSLLPLYTALIYHNNYAVDKLLKSGADPNKKNLVPLLYYATIENDAQSVKSLLEAGADTSVTFMGFTAAEAAFIRTDFEVQKQFIEFQNKRFETPETDINKSLEILKNSKYGNRFYEIINGANPTGKPFRIVFCDLTNFGSKNYKLVKVPYYLTIKENELRLFINNTYRNEPESVLAAILGGASINIDGKTSVIEELVSTGIMAQLWLDFSTENPELRNGTTILTKGLNTVSDWLNQAAGDRNILWMLKSSYGKLPMKSKGFKDEDLNKYYPKDSAVSDFFCLN